MGTKVTVQANVIRSNDGERTVVENILANDGFTPLADLQGTDYVTKDNLIEGSYAPPDPSIIDIPADTATPYFIDYAADYPQHGSNPDVWVEIYRQEDSPIITEEIAVPIQRARLGAAVETLNIMFADNPTIDHYRVVIK